MKWRVFSFFILLLLFLSVLHKRKEAHLRNWQVNLLHEKARQAWKLKEKGKKMDISIFQMFTKNVMNDLCYRQKKNTKGKPVFSNHSFHFFPILNIFLMNIGFYEFRVLNKLIVYIFTNCCGRQLARAHRKTKQKGCVIMRSNTFRFFWISYASTLARSI